MHLLASKFLASKFLVTSLNDLLLIVSKKLVLIVLVVVCVYLELPRTLSLCFYLSHVCECHFSFYSSNLYVLFGILIYLIIILQSQSPTVIYKLNCLLHFQLQHDPVLMRTGSWVPRSGSGCHESFSGSLASQLPSAILRLCLHV